MKRLDYLKRKNRRSMVIKELENYLTVSHDSFLSIEANESTKINVFNKIKTGKETSIGDSSLGNSVKISKLKIIDYLKSRKPTSEVFLLILCEFGIELVRLRIKDIHENLDRLLDYMKFNEGYSDFIIVSTDLSWGLSIERGEYNYYLTRW